MKYQEAKQLKTAEFKRFWGVKPETFEKMVETIRTNPDCFVSNKSARIGLKALYRLG